MKLNNTCLPSGQIGIWKDVCKKLAGTLLLAILSMLFSCSGAKHQQDPSPNILLIIVDDLNDWVGCLGGHPQVETPNIDYLASKGVLFANAHCQTAICNPSRTSIMTSLYPSTTGIYFNAGNLEDSPVIDCDDVLTRRFEKEDYYVCGAGKIFHGGRDHFYMENYAGEFGGFGPLPKEKLTTFSGHQLWDWGPYPDRDDQMPDHRISDWGVNQLQKKYDKPFFIGIGFYRPHVPLYVPQKWFDLYPLETIQLPDIKQQDLNDISQYAFNLTHLEHIEPTHEWILENDQWNNLVQAYLACISFVDYQIGKVVNALENSPYKENTYIVLYSDNGFHLGEKGIWAKQTLWEESTRVPMIVVGPDIPEGKVCIQPVQLLDIYPTLLEITGHEADPELEGHSLVPLLKEPEAAWPYPARSSFGPGNYAIRSERYRYIHYNDGSEEFYDHKTDPHEWYNQINKPEFAEIIKEHKAFLPETSYPILGSGSTGHKAYAAAEALRKNKK